MGKKIEKLIERKFHIRSSGFVRSVFMRTLAIFIIVSIVISVIAFLSFTSEIRSSMLSDRQKQLAAVENTFSERMSAIISIAYNIGKDPAFYQDSLESDQTSELEMAQMMDRYLVGYSFIVHLAFTRTADPDTIYTTSGARSLKEFFVTTLGMDDKTASATITKIHSINEAKMKLMGKGENAYLVYEYPLPQLSVKPKAHVLFMIPAGRVRPIFDALLVDPHSGAAIFDDKGNELYRAGNEDDTLPFAEYAKNGASEEIYTSASGQKYVFQKVVSETNGWVYIAAIRHEDTLSGLANKQMIFLGTTLALLAFMTIIMLLNIITQYKPIRNLAIQVTDNPDENQLVDERTLLSNALTTLKDDSEQKQKYEMAFHEAEAASQAKSAFLSSMSHDIRTPMNAIIGMTALALKHKDDSVYMEDCLKKIQVSSEYLLDIINNVLDMSRIESGRVPIAKEPVIIPALIDSVVSLMTSSIEAKGLTLDVDMSGLRHIAVFGDNIHIVQVFVNILSNAVKFTPKGGKLTLQVSQTESDEPEYGNYVFSFSDTGIGIPPDFVDHVFDTFSRADRPMITKTEGTGLGMAIAKKLVELMNGTISCKSKLGIGTTFTVNMHMKLVDENKLNSSDSQSKKLRNRHAQFEGTVKLNGKRILLVEDNALNLEIARKIICETGADVIDATNGEQAVNAFSTHPAGYFDFIFMDIHMPVMNGYEATKLIRSMDRPDASTIPIYAMTANTFDEDVRKVKEAGMDGHIGKPYNPDTLYRTLAEVLCS